jgi:hypothetical protein
MDIGLFVGICLVSLGLAAFGMLIFSFVLVIRVTARKAEASLKWEFLDVLKDADKHVQSPRHRDERIQSVSNQTKRGEAS